MYGAAEDLATVDTASAYQAGELIFVRLAGKKPTACHIVTIERALTDVEPPAFLARQRIDPRARCMPVVTEYEAVQGFRIGGARESVLVHHAEGELSVAVTQVDVEGLRALEGTDGLGDPFGQPAEADGYSRSFDLGEALRDAIAKLPPRGAGIPDWLASYSVVAIGVEIGGVAGFNHLKVTVRG